MRKFPIFLSTLSLCTYFSNHALAAKWNDPGIQVQYSGGQFRDQLGRVVSIAGMPDDIRQSLLGTSSASSAPTVPEAPSSPPVPAEAPAPEVSPRPDTSPSTPSATTASKLKNKGWGSMTTTGKVASVVGGVAGTIGLASSAMGQGEHSAGNMVTGIASGITAGCSIGSMIPGYGTLIGCAVGLVAGIAVPGSQLWSETDCMQDPVTGKFTCCNTLFNKGERQVEIGGYMFCSVEENGQVVAKPGVRQCLQGGSDKPASWWDGLWKDDAWSPECTIRYCNGEPPADTYVDIYADTEKFCYNWRLPEGGSNTDPYVIVKQKIESQIQQLQSQCGNLL